MNAIAIGGHDANGVRRNIAAAFALGGFMASNAYATTAPSDTASITTQSIERPRTDQRFETACVQRSAAKGASTQIVNSVMSRRELLLRPAWSMNASETGAATSVDESAAALSHAGDRVIKTFSAYFAT